MGMSQRTGETSSARVCFTSINQSDCPKECKSKGVDINNFSGVAGCYYTCGNTVQWHDEVTYVGHSDNEIHK